MRTAVALLAVVVADDSRVGRAAAPGVSIEVVVDDAGLAIRGHAALTLLHDRRTVVGARFVNRTASAATAALDAASDGVGVAPLRVPLAAGATVDAAIAITPLQAGNLEVEWVAAVAGSERRLRQRLIAVPGGRLLVRVADRGGRTVPAHVRVEAADGRCYAPDGVAGPEFDSEGLFELEVPAGPVVVRAAPMARGNAVAAATAAVARVRVEADRTARLVVRLP